MKLAFLTGALASGFAVGGLAAFGVWVASVLTGTGTGEPWSVAPWLVVGLSVVATIGTYAAERIVYRRAMARMRATGEPWAYRG